MHWALESAKRGNRFGLKAGHRHHVPARRDVPVRPDQRVRPHRLLAGRHARRRSVFYGLTGLHGAHVFIGLTLLAMVTIRAFRGHFTARGAPRRRGAGHLLALRRRHVGDRLHDGLHPLSACSTRCAPSARRSASCSTWSRWRVVIVVVLMVRRSCSAHTVGRGVRSSGSSSRSPWPRGCTCARCGSCAAAASRSRAGQIACWHTADGAVGDRAALARIRPLGDDLLSAHMAQHLLIADLAAPIAAGRACATRCWSSYLPRPALVSARPHALAAQRVPRSCASPWSPRRCGCSWSTGWH